MAVQNKKDIALGLGTLEFGTFDANGDFVSYRDVGAIKANVNISITREILDFESGRPLITLLQEVIRENVTLTAQLAEVSLANIKAVLGQGVETNGSVPTFLTADAEAPTGTLEAGTVPVGSSDILEFGGVPSLEYLAVRFTHQKQSGKRQIFEGFKASPSGNLALPFNESDWNLYDVELRLLADTDRPAGQQYFQFVREIED